jgi:hypothetical protein
MMLEAIRSSETSVITKGTRRQIPENDIFHDLALVPCDAKFVTQKCS